MIHTHTSNTTGETASILRSCLYIYTNISTYIHICTFIHLHIFACMHIQRIHVLATTSEGPPRSPASAYTYIHKYIYRHIHIYTYIHIYIYTFMKYTYTSNNTGRATSIPSTCFIIHTNMSTYKYIYEYIHVHIFACIHIR